MSTATITETNSQNGAFGNVTVGDLVSQNPGRARVMEKHNIDYCCRGNKLLSDVCAEEGLDLSAVTTELSAYDAEHSVKETEWATAPLSQLADHIAKVHHGYLKEELPRLEYLADRVLNAHGAKYEHLAELNQVVHGLSTELMLHTNKEDNVLFPWIKKLESAKSSADIDSSSVSAPITVMMSEHDDAGEALEKIKELTDDFTPPSGTCNTHRVFLSTLKELETDMHTHIHKENSILFPRAIARETELRA